MLLVFFFKQKTAYEMRISDWSSDVCSSDLHVDLAEGELALGRFLRPIVHVIERVEHARAEPWQRIVRRHILPRTAQKAVAFEERGVLVLVGVARRTLDPWVRGPHQALLVLHQLQDVFLRADMLDFAWLRIILSSEERRVGKRCVRKCR